MNLLSAIEKNEEKLNIYQQLFIDGKTTALSMMIHEISTVHQFYSTIESYFLINFKSEYTSEELETAMSEIPKLYGNIYKHFGDLSKDSPYLYIYHEARNLIINYDERQDTKKDILITYERLKCLNSLTEPCNVLYDSVISILIETCFLIENKINSRYVDLYFLKYKDVYSEYDKFINSCDIENMSYSEKERFDDLRTIMGKM